ncbi:MAG: hypothetical protein LBD32_01770, partial [Cytophagales bacterium]|nr:hypothetical protein [Cytophagales bacterium]
MSKWLNDFPDRFVVNLFQSLGIAFHLGVVSSCGDPKFRFNVPDVLTVTPSIEKALDVVLTVEDTEGLRSALESLGNAITNNKIYPGTAEDAVREKLSGKFEFVKNDGGEVDFVYNGKTGKIVMAHNVGEENGFTACLKWCNCLKIINRRFVLNPVTCGISPGVLLKTSSLRRQDIEIFKQKIVCGKGNEADKIQYGFGENPPSVLLTSTLVGEIGSLWCRFP